MGLRASSLQPLYTALALPYNNLAKVSAATPTLSMREPRPRRASICLRLHGEEEAELGSRGQVRPLLSLYFSGTRGFFHTLTPFLNRQALG